MNIVLWIAQVLLLFMYGFAGSTKVFNTAKARESMTWTEGRTDNFVHFVGVAELLGALGMILPMLTGILPWLTPLAGVGLALIQILAIVTEHLPKKEYKILPFNLVLLALAVFVVAGRWSLFHF
jgi:protein-S-isoprenylcysteine O-methyltransferase Ste14